MIVHHRYDEDDDACVNYSIHWIIDSKYDDVLVIVVVVVVVHE